MTWPTSWCCSWGWWGGGTRRRWVAPRAASGSEYYLVPSTAECPVFTISKHYLVQSTAGCLVFTCPVSASWLEWSSSQVVGTHLWHGNMRGYSDGNDCGHLTAWQVMKSVTMARLIWLWATSLPSLPSLTTPARPALLATMPARPLRMLQPGGVNFTL